MPRIIAGRSKGRRLKVPAGRGTRPTGGRVRQVFFDILGERVREGAFLDGFAGSGGVGLEALSRGAPRVVFVEHSAAATSSLRTNLDLLDLDPGRCAQIMRLDAIAALKALGVAGEQFGTIYLDPPYDSDLYEPAMKLVDDLDLLAAGGRLVAEHFHKRWLPETIGRLSRSREIRVGEHRLSFYRPLFD